jgi:hypothetical protein
MSATSAFDDRLPASQTIPRRFPATVQDLVTYTGRLYHDGQIRCVIRMAGRMDTERLAQAFRLTPDAELVLSYRLVDHPLRHYIERRHDLVDLPLCPVVAGVDVEASLWSSSPHPSMRAGGQSRREHLPGCAHPDCRLLRWCSPAGGRTGLP